MENEKIKRETNMVAYFFKCFAWVDLVVGIFITNIAIFTFNDTVEIPFLTIVLSIIGIVISFVFIYAIGEIIQIIHDIRKRLYETTEVKEKKEQITLSDEN